MAIDVYSEYTALPWQAKAHVDDWKHGCFVGGKGGGKTRFVVEEFIANAMEFPGSAYLIGRKTLPSLKDTTMREFMEAIPHQLIRDFNKSDRNLYLQNDSLFIFRSLDEPKKFESLKLTGFAIDEADEIDIETYNTLKSRMRQMIKGKEPRFRSALILNPCDEDHWIPSMFMHNPPPGHKLFYCSTMDNMENLPAQYLDDLKSIYTPDMQQRMIHGMFGKVHRGRPVYPEFKRGNYIANIEHDKNNTIYRGWDFGYNRPAVVWMQFINGRVIVLAEKMGRKIYLDDFIKDEILPLQQNLFPGHQLYRDFCDPHGSDENDKGKTSVDIMHDFGMFPIFRRTSVEEGIKATRSLMNTKNIVDGQPNYVVHPRCKLLIEGDRGGYHREDGSEEPFKDGHYDHIQDGRRYSIVHLVKRYKAGLMQQAFDAASPPSYSRTGRFME